MGSVYSSDEGATPGRIPADLASSILGGVHGNLISGSALTNDVVLALLKNCGAKCTPCDNKAPELRLEIELD